MSIFLAVIFYLIPIGSICYKLSGAKSDSDNLLVEWKNYIASIVICKVEILCEMIEI